MVNQPLKVKKPSAILFDFSGTAVRETFVEKYLMPYYKVAYKVYFEVNWDKPECQEDVKALAAASQADSAAPKVDTGGDKKAQVEQLAKYAEYCEKAGKNGKAFVMYRFHVWFDGYERGKITTPVYQDVADNIKAWAKKKIKLFIVSNGWSEATKRFMQKTTHGDLAAIIEEQFDTSIGPLNEAATFKKIVDKIKEKPDSVLFLTKSPEEAKVAVEAGLGAVMVLTHNNAVDSAKETCKGVEIPIARSFQQLEFN